MSDFSCSISCSNSEKEHDDCFVDYITNNTRLHHNASYAIDSKLLEFVKENFINEFIEQNDDQFSSSSYCSRESGDDFGYCDDSTRLIMVECDDGSVIFHISISPSINGLSLIVEQLCGSMNNFVPFEWKTEKSFRLVIDGDKILLVEQLEMSINQNSFEINKEYLDNIMEPNSIGIVTIIVGRFEINICFILNDSLSCIKIPKSREITDEKSTISLQNERISFQNTIDLNIVKSNCCMFDKELSLIEITLEKVQQIPMFTPISGVPSLLGQEEHSSLENIVEEKDEVRLYFSGFLNSDTRPTLQFNDSKNTKLQLESLSYTELQVENRQFRTVTSFRDIVAKISDRVDHKFLEMTKNYSNVVDRMGFNFLQCLISAGKKELAKTIVEKLGFDPVEKNVFKWIHYFNNPNGISMNFILTCWSNYLLKDSSEESSLSSRVRLVMHKLGISSMNEETSISIQNHLLPQCYLCNFYTETSDYVTCHLSIVVMKEIRPKLGILFGRWILYWNDNSLVYILNVSQKEVSILCTLEEITTEKRLESIVRVLCETTCGWNGRKLFNKDTCNSGHFILSFLKKSMLWNIVPDSHAMRILSYSTNKTTEFINESITIVDQFSVGKSILFSKTNYQLMDCERLMEIINTSEEPQHEEECEFLNDLDFIRDDMYLIGEGGFGKVFKCQLKTKDEWKVLKIVETDVEYELNACKKFINLRHDNLVPIEDFGMLGDELFILMPFYEEGDLTTFINEHGHFLSEKNIIQIFHQISKSLDYLHNIKIIHRDVKLKNIFVSSYCENGDINVALGDFGCFLDLDNPNSEQHLLGSESYKPPENEHTPKSDVWSLAVCILQLILINEKSTLNLTSEMLFDSGEKCRILKSISDDNLREILNQCLDSSPSTRIDSCELSISLQILAHK